MVSPLLPQSLTPCGTELSTAESDVHNPPKPNPIAAAKAEALSPGT